MHKTDNEPIRLSYQRGSHYNSIVDPYKATIGVGLGLPGYSPGSADRNLIKDVTRHSEELAIEQVQCCDVVLNLICFRESYEPYIIYLIIDHA